MVGREEERERERERVCDGCLGQWDSIYFVGQCNTASIKTELILLSKEYIW